MDIMEEYLGLYEEERDETEVDPETALCDLIQLLEKIKSPFVGSLPFTLVENLATSLERSTIANKINKMSLKLKQKLMVIAFSTVRQPSIMLDCLCSDKKGFFPFYQNESIEFVPGTRSRINGSTYFMGNPENLCKHLKQLDVISATNIAAGLTSREPRWQFDFITSQEAFEVLKEMYKIFTSSKDLWRSQVFEILSEASFFQEPLNLVLNSYNSREIVQNAVEDSKHDVMKNMAGRMIGKLINRRHKSRMTAQSQLLSKCFVDLIDEDSSLEHMCKTENRRSLLRVAVRESFAKGSLSIFLQDLRQISSIVQFYKDCFLLVFVLRRIGDEEIIALLNEQYPTTEKLRENKQIQLIPDKIILSSNLSISLFKAI